MGNPVLVEVLRGETIESRHRGAFAVVDAQGRLVLGAGDIDAAVFPRSAVKALQALPLVASGAADKLALGDAELALACASHSGAPAHVETARAMLARAGRGEDCLACGAHWPLDQETALALAASGGRPGALHNNCSGKHAGFICLACAEGIDPAGYTQADHPVQLMVRRALSTATGFSHDHAASGVDGCSIPTYAAPLRALALGFARFGTGIGLPDDFAAAAARIARAVAARPDMVAGEGRFDTVLMRALGARVFVKTGAEGVYCAALPEIGIGIALKCDDGATRAAEAIMARLVRAMLPLHQHEAQVLTDLAEPVLRNWNGIETGRLRAAHDLDAALAVSRPWI